MVFLIASITIGEDHKVYEWHLFSGGVVGTSKASVLLRQWLHPLVITHGEEGKAMFYGF